MTHTLEEAASSTAPPCDAWTDISAQMEAFKLQPALEVAAPSMEGTQAEPIHDAPMPLSAPSDALPAQRPPEPELCLRLDPPAPRGAPPVLLGLDPACGYSLTLARRALSANPGDYPKARSIPVPGAQ